MNYHIIKNHKTNHKQFVRLTRWQVEELYNKIEKGTVSFNVPIQKDKPLNW